MDQFNQYLQIADLEGIIEKCKQGEGRREPCVFVLSVRLERQNKGMQNTASPHSLKYENSTYYCIIQRDHSQTFSIAFILCAAIKTQSTFLFKVSFQTRILNLEKNKKPLHLKIFSLSIIFMFKCSSSLTLLSMRISLNSTSIIQPTVSMQHLS